MSKWNEQSAKRCIKRSRGKIDGKKIAIPNAGIKVQGACDYLVNYCGYRRI